MRHYQERLINEIIYNMKSLLIKDTTISERREIVKNALNFGGGECEGIDMEDMYDSYILGKKELAEINMEFSQKYAGSIMAHPEEGIKECNTKFF